MVKRIASVLAALMLLSVALAGCGGAKDETPSGGDKGGSQETVTIEYWQYYYESKVKLMDELIKEFEAQNPGIKVKHVHYPYEQYNEKVAASVAAGKGPDVINLYYGWLPLYVDSGFLQPLPADAFPAEEIEKEFLPIVRAAKLDGKYYVLPVAVRTLALLYNKDIFAEVGVTEPPKTWDELVEVGKKTVVWDGNKLERVGFYFNTGGQGHHWFREVLVRQAGGQPLSDDNKQVLWNSEAGKKAFKWWIGLQTKHKIGQMGFLEDDVTAFKAGKAAMVIDGSFRLGNLKDVPFDFASAPLPVGPNGEPYTMGSFWANGITKKATGAKLEAAVKFLKFLTTPEVMERWTEAVGELPARPEVAEKFKDDPKMKGFIDGLPYANATFFVDEKKDRQAIIDAVDKVILEGADPDQALDEAAKKVQALYDEFWAKRSK